MRFWILQASVAGTGLVGMLAVGAPACGSSSSAPDTGETETTNECPELCYATQSCSDDGDCAHIYGSRCDAIVASCTGACCGTGLCLCGQPASCSISAECVAPFTCCNGTCCIVEDAGADASLDAPDD